MTEVHHPLPAAGAYTRRVEARIPDEGVLRWAAQGTPLRLGSAP
jgi:hypothetical protein